MPRKTPDPDFDIFIDPSCLSAPMDDENPATENTNHESPAPEILEEENVEQVWVAEDAPAVEDSIVEEPDMEEETCAEVKMEEEPKNPDTEEEEKPENLATEEEEQEPENLNTEEGESIIEEEQPIDELAAEADLDLTQEDAEEVDDPDKSELMSTGDHLEDDLVDEGENEESELMPTEDDIVDEVENEEIGEIGDESIDHSLVEDVQEEQPGYYDDDEDEDTPRATQIIDNDDAADEDTSSRRESGVSQRRTSLRTEALIQATAREVVAKIEADARARVSARYSDEHRYSNEHRYSDEHDTSILSAATHDSHGVDGIEMAYEDGDDQSDTSRRESGGSSGSQIHHHVAAHSVSGESSSHPEPDDDDVFSDHSPRSSLGSADGGIDTNFKLPAESDVPSPRMPRVSDISGISQYDKEEFIPMSRNTPRVPFRTPTAVRALQMSSPTPSVYSGGTPRSSKRHTGFVTISRLGSPTASAQYSPKGRSTPPRFKTKEAPLVLLHVTLMPLRWMWGDVLSGLDTINCGVSDASKRFEPSDELKTLRGAWRQLQDRIGDTVLERGILLPHPQNDYEILEERLLEALELPLRRRARILECGHYLGPAEDDDVEEEESDDDTYGHSPRDRTSEKRHWCNTCRGEIRYEDLGPGKTFRVKVYASNGLMKAGAWGACWKEMERVDIELEPVVEATLHAELERLAAVQAEMEEERQRELDREEERQQRQLSQGPEEHPVEEELPAVLRSSELCRADPRSRALSPTASSPPPPPATMRITMHASPPEPLTSSPLRVLSPPATRHTPLIDLSDERRYRDEERLREIYGHTPPRTHPEVEETPLPPHTEHPASARPPHPDSYIPPPSPPSPSEEAFGRRSGRRADDEHPQQHGRPYQSASLQELLLESARVLLRDRKNLAIVLLSFFVLMMATRPSHSPPPLQQPRDAVVAHDNAYRFQADPEPTVVAAVADAAEESVAMEATVPDVASLEEPAPLASSNPYESAAGQGAASLAKESVVAEPEIVRVRETITETVRVSVTMSEPESVETEATLEPEALKLTVYETQTETVKVTASAVAEPATGPEPELEIADATPSMVAEPEVEDEAETEAEALEATSSSPAEASESAVTEGAEAETAIPVPEEAI